MKDGLQDLASTTMKMKSFISEVEWAFITTLNPDIAIQQVLENYPTLNTRSIQALFAFKADRTSQH
jgi:hypothetical protein